MLKRFATLLVILPLVAIAVSAQGLDTRASKDDWEEINYEFNSSVLVDGFPSLLRLAELLQQNPGYHVKVEGHTDRIGGNNYNDKLGMARAQTVRDFLVKYGARANQIDVATRGKADPKYPGQKPNYSRTDEARWMNRRVMLTVTDQNGREVSAAGVREAIQAVPAQPAATGMTDCCSEVLKRLDKLDDIAKMLQGLADQNAALQKEIDALKQNQQVIESRVNQPVPQPPSAAEIAGELAKNQKPKFEVLNINAGGDSNGNVTFSGKGRFFAPFGDHYAFQAQAEYLAFHGQKEGQLDVGLVDRIGPFQAGLFSSFKHVNFSAYQSGGTLGEAALTLDYIFKYGKVGLFGTKGFMNEAVVNRVNAVLANGFVSPDLYTETYLRIVDQVGVSAALGLWGNNYLEGNAGFLRSYGTGDHFGGTLRFIFPLNNKVAFTVEGDMNPTLVGPGNDGRAVVGLQFGNALRPKEFQASDYAVPVDVPRIRYDILTRTIRVGHTPPVADAGPNQTGVPAGTITLNGSGSYSPDGLPLTYQWTQQAGPGVTLSAATAPITTFTAAAGQAYTFSLMVKDSLGGQAMARVTITTTQQVKPSIGFFIANPTNINPGQSSTLSWNVTGADSVTLSTVGGVPAVGSQQVSPTQTTTYTLTATGGGTTVTAQATVSVGSAQTQAVYCYATPANIMAGESATLYYQFQNATSIAISGIGTVGNGSVAVTPTTTTNYTITGNGAGGATASCSVSVTVTAGALPRIIQFSANPQTVSSGQPSTLVWVVDNATTVNITSLGNVQLAGSQAVTPSATTMYTLTATNASGSITSQATITVGGGPTITSFTATPPSSPSPGTPITLACAANNAASINIAGTPITGSSGTITVRPTQTTSYTCTATSSTGQTASQTINVSVAAGQPPVVQFASGNSIITTVRYVTVDASASFSPAGNSPLTYQWTAVNNSASIVGATGGTAQVTLPFNVVPGTYLFNVTVTDSKGLATTAQIAVTYIEDNVPQ